MPKNAPVQAQPIPAARPAPVADSPWLGRILLALGAGVVVLVALAYISGGMGDGPLGIILAALVAVAATGRTASQLLEHAGTSVARASVVVLALIVVALSVVPVTLAIIPGKPVTTGVLTQVGDTLPLPEAAHGPVRLFVEGNLAAAGATTVEFDISGTSALTEGKLGRTVSTRSVGRRGVAQSSNETNTVYLDATIDGAQHQLKLERLDGSLTGGLLVKVFPERLPLWLDIVAGVLALAAVALLAAFLQVGTDAVVAAGLALAFGAFAHEWVTPDTVVRPLIGAAIAGLVAGGAAGGLFASLAHRIFPPPVKGKAKAKA